MSALPIFPGRRQPSIFGASELNCRVRNGNGWTLTAISTDYSISPTLGSIGKPTKCLSMEMRKQRREQAFTLARKRAIRSLLSNGDPYESRTRVCGVRGRRLNHLTNGPFCVARVPCPRTLKTEQCDPQAACNLLIVGQALGLLVSVSSTRHRAYTSDLSTSSSTTCLTPDG